MSGISKPASFDKPYLRDYYLERRKILLQNIDHKNALDMEIQSRLLVSPEYRACDTVLVYIARADEIATSLIIHAALANNKQVASPCCTDGGEMIFRRLRSVSELIPGRFGILEPPASAPVVTADAHTLCVCPSLCCDMRGMRLGFGGGYYDRYLAGFAGFKAALCYSDSLIPELLHDDYDIPMDAVITDSFTRYSDHID